MSKAADWHVDGVDCLFLVPGGLLITAGIVISLWTMGFNNLASHAQGTVIENHLSPGQGSDASSYYPEVEFETPDGHRHRFVSNSGAAPPSFNVGERVSVVYAHNHPDSSASINTFGQQYGLTLFLCGMGVIFMLPTGIPLYLRVKKTVSPT